MTKKELIHTITQEKLYREKSRGRRRNLANNKMSAEWLDCILTVIEDALITDGKVKITGFGTLEVRTHAGYDGLNPKTGEPMCVPEKRAIKFIPSKRIKNRLEGKEEIYDDDDEEDYYEHFFDSDDEYGDEED